MKISDSIGFVCISMASYQKERVTAITSSYSNYGGYATHLTRNAFGSICMSSDRKPRVWKTEAGAQKYATQHNADIDKYGHSGRFEVIVVPIFRTDISMRDQVTAATWNAPGVLRAAIRAIDEAAA